MSDNDVKSGDISGVIPSKVYNLTEVSTILGSDPRSIKKVLKIDDNSGLNFFKVGDQYRFLGEHIQQYVGTASYNPQPSQLQTNQLANGSATMNEINKI